MKICNICHKISATDKDHVDCVERRSIEMEEGNFKESIPERMNLSGDNRDLGVEIRAVLEHLTKDKMMTAD